MSNQDIGRSAGFRLSLFLRGSLAALLLLAVGAAFVQLVPDNIRSGGVHSGLVDIAQGMVVEVLLLGPMTTTLLLGK